MLNMQEQSNPIRFTESIEEQQTAPVKVRNRTYLAGSTSLNMPETLPAAGAMLPILTLEGSATYDEALVVACRAKIIEKLDSKGAVLLRGLPLCGEVAFNRLMEDLAFEPGSYKGGIAVRGRKASMVFHASDEPGSISMAPHNEMAYLPGFPRKLFFFCDRQSTTGGEVPINDIRETIKLIPEEVLQQFRDKGIRYYRTLPKESREAEIGWKETFGSADKAEVAEYLTEEGYDFEWQANDDLVYSYRHEAFCRHPETGEELWFNQVTELHCSYWREHPLFAADMADLAYPATTAFGDGTPIDPDLITFLRAMIWKTSRAVVMQPGDVLALDNLLIQHGRLSFEGPRRHLVSMAK